MRRCGRSVLLSLKVFYTQDKKPPAAFAMLPSAPQDLLALRRLSITALRPLEDKVTASFVTKILSE